MVFTVNLLVFRLHLMRCGQASCPHPNAGAGTCQHLEKKHPSVAFERPHRGAPIQFNWSVSRAPSRESFKSIPKHMTPPKRAPHRMASPNLSLNIVLLTFPSGRGHKQRLWGPRTDICYWTSGGAKVSTPGHGSLRKHCFLRSARRHTLSPELRGGGPT